VEAARSFYERYYPAWGELSEEEVRQNGAFGPPAEVAEAIEGFVDAGVETFVVRFAADDQRTQLRRFVDRVR
jgi:alkanesulfonate monooxygenase SsuD/methylene tetrahydromethanopterin reductase-like flavin-dependent oxidoreductase (luciferase family)